MGVSSDVAHGQPYGWRLHRPARPRSRSRLSVVVHLNWVRVAFPARRLEHCVEGKGISEQCSGAWWDWGSGVGVWGGVG